MELVIKNIIVSVLCISDNVINLIEKSTFSFGRGSLSVLIKYVSCRGYESNIGECTYGTTELSDCLHYGSDVIGVHCIQSEAYTSYKV